MTGSSPKPAPTARERELDALAQRYEDRLEERETVVSVFGAARRSGPWAPPEETRAIAGFARVVLDFTEADLPAGITDVDAWAVFADVEIRVPRSLEVELNGIALLGSLIHQAGGGDTRKRFRRWLRLAGRASRETEPRADAEAVLCVRGTAFFGNVILKVV